MSEKSFTQRFDYSMSSFSSEKEIKYDNLIYTVRGDKTLKVWLKEDAGMMSVVDV